MKLIKKYLPLLLGGFILAGGLYPLHISAEWIGLVAVFIVIILIFEAVEDSRIRRIKRRHFNSSKKIEHILKFSLFIGLPLSIILIFLIHKKAELLFSILFILVPLTIIFGWIGFLDWQKCNQLSLEEKYRLNDK